MYNEKALISKSRLCFEKYDVITEATYGFTLVTIKRRSIIKNEFGSFIYSEISEELFTGYRIFNFLNYQYYEATKAKALFDWLYYRIDSVAYIRDGVNVVNDLRLNLDSFTKGDFREMKDYAKLSRRKDVILNIINHIQYYAHDNK